MFLIINQIFLKINTKIQQIIEILLDKTHVIFLYYLKYDNHLLELCNGCTDINALDNSG